MKPHSRLDSAKVRRLADAIVKVVSDGAMTLAQIDDIVEGFSETDNARPSWSWETDDAVIWNCMTQEGCAALRQIVLTGRVALQPSSFLVYLLQGQTLNDPNWLPIALAPAASANMQISSLLLSVPSDKADHIIAFATAAKMYGFRKIHRNSGGRP